MKNLVFILVIIITYGVGSSKSERKPYIVYMGELSPGLEQLAVAKHHHNLLTEAIGDESIAREAKIHSYGRSFNGFVAKLLPHEATALSEKSNVVSVFPNTIRKLLTTGSWDFLGMSHDLKQRNQQTESNVIMGFFDTGIYIDAPSFNDEGYGPPPTKWKGQCYKGGNFTGCNRKVIGARYYDLGEKTGMDPTPADTDGHETHTASTAAGRSVQGASLYGVASGTALGGVPNGRIAVYKVCGTFGCSNMNLLAGFDDAIADGVDILSVSISGPTKNFMDDVIAIGSFHAMQKGVLTVCAAGNDGPDLGKVNNVAPWILTVAATNIDRNFRTMVQFGNGLILNGTSINTFATKKAMYPLTSSTTVHDGSQGPYADTSMCGSGLSEAKVKGRIVLCMGPSSADWTVKKKCGTGTIISIDEPLGMAPTTLIPASFVSFRNARAIAHYINTTKSPQAIIHKTVTVNTTKPPKVASFSSRGPQTIAKNILKPDLSAPGVDILAGYSKLASITGEDLDNRFSVFNIMPGTSMATPHVAGAAAYVKSFHPDWSPAAIKSALMTTANPVNGRGEDPLSSGSGLLNLIDAVRPGLIYDLKTNDYIRFLCMNGYNKTSLSLMNGNKNWPHYDFSKFKRVPGADVINYPSMHLYLRASDTRVSKVFYRRVTHVGRGTAVYRSRVISPKGFSIRAIPNVLSFTKTQQSLPFKVVVKGNITSDTPEVTSTFFEWYDPRVRVRSPVQIYKPLI